MPEIVGPQVQVDGGGEIFLEWADAEDPDGDPPNYKIKWWPSVNENASTTEELYGTRVSLGPLAVGQDITWKVRASDLWGSSEWSELQRFVVVEPPEEEPPSACAHVGIGSAVWAWLPVWWRRRRVPVVESASLSR
jgi:hypothetical protein